MTSRNVETPGTPVELGIHAGATSTVCLRLHRLAEWLYRCHLGWCSRAIQLLNRILTGADIDPGARISSRALIPHTIGIVVGQTAVVEEGAVLMPHVVLGAAESGMDGRRHPHICAEAQIGSGAVVLGPVTVGRCARVGANAVVVEDVPPGVTVVGIPAKPLSQEEKS